jgi:hypothetical protein
VKPFLAVALVVMAAFFVWLLLQMSRTWQADQRLITMAFAFVCIFAALGLGAVLGRSGRRR